MEVGFLPKETLLNIYNDMFQAFGPQHWWPADDDFEVIVGAILTQSVSWKNVEKAIDNLKKEGLMSLEAILSADNEKLAGLIRSTMYYNQKAKKLKNFCQYIARNYEGDIHNFFKNDVSQMRDQLLGIKGIGPETADSIILYAAEKPIFVVDAYTRRIFSRLGFFCPDVSYDEMQSFFMDNLPLDTALFNEYHALIVRLGKECCKNKGPLCSECPVKIHCSNM